jgi:hypothetical protein
MTYDPNKEPRDEDTNQESLENNEGMMDGVPGQRTTSVQFPKIEKYEIDPKTQEDIENLAAEAKFRAGENGDTNEKIGNITYQRNNIVEKMNDDHVTTKKPWFKRAAVAVAFTAASMFGAKAHGENLSDSTEKSKNKIEKVTSITNESREEVNSQLRLEWNKYVDWLESKGLKGDESLDHGGKGVEMVKQYMAEHPGTILNPEVIDDIQEEFVKYRDWSLKQIEDGKANFGPGVNKENYMRALSIVDKIPGQRTTSFKFPESYLSTFENNKLVKTENQGFAKIVDKKIPDRNPMANSDFVKSDNKFKKNK